MKFFLTLMLLTHALFCSQEQQPCPSLPPEIWQQILSDVPGNKLFVIHMLHKKRDNGTPFIQLTEQHAHDMLKSIQKYNKRSLDDNHFIVESQMLKDQLQKYERLFSTFPYDTQNKFINYSWDYLNTNFGTSKSITIRMYRLHHNFFGNPDRRETIDITFCKPNTCAQVAQMLLFLNDSKNQSLRNIKPFENMLQEIPHVYPGMLLKD